jgi:putative ABC transport system substrate-binding protein
MRGGRIERVHIVICGSSFWNHLTKLMKLEFMPGRQLCDEMKITNALHLFAVGLLSALGNGVLAQQDSVAVVGLLVGAAAPNDRAVEAFRAGMRELGHEEGRNLKIEFRTAEGHPDRLPRLAEELVQLRPDVIVVGNETGARLLKRATSTIPIVLVNNTDPVGGGLVSNLSHPGGNITGLTSMAAELISKRLQLLKEAIPQLARVTVVRDPGGTSRPPYNVKLVEQLQAAAPLMSIELKFVDVRRPDDFLSAFKRTTESHKQGVYVADCALCYLQRRKLAEIAAENRIPAIYVTRAFADDGGLMSYGVDYAAAARRAAVYVDKILRGAKPGDLPIEQPTKFELVVNLRTAKALGITIPESILLRADEVIR